MDYDDLPEYLTHAEAAKFVGYSPKTLHNLNSAGDGPPRLSRNGRTLRYPKAALREWSEARWVKK